MQQANYIQELCIFPLNFSQYFSNIHNFLAIQNPDYINSKDLMPSMVLYKVDNEVYLYISFPAPVFNTPSGNKYGNEMYSNWELVVDTLDDNKIKIDNIVLDLRGNQGGVLQYFYALLLPLMRTFIKQEFNAPLLYGSDNKGETVVAAFDSGYSINVFDQDFKFNENILSFSRKFAEYMQKDYNVDIIANHMTASAAEYLALILIKNGANIYGTNVKENKFTYGMLDNYKVIGLGMFSFSSPYLYIKMHPEDKISPNGIELKLNYPLAKLPKWNNLPIQGGLHSYYDPVSEKIDYNIIKIMYEKGITLMPGFNHVDFDEFWEPNEETKEPNEFMFINSIHLQNMIRNYLNDIKINPHSHLQSDGNIIHTFSNKHFNYIYISFATYMSSLDDNVNRINEVKGALAEELSKMDKKIPTYIDLRSAISINGLYLIQVLHVFLADLEIKCKFKKSKNTNGYFNFTDHISKNITLNKLYLTSKYPFVFHNSRYFRKDSKPVHKGKVIFYVNEATWENPNVHTMMIFHSLKKHHTVIGKLKNEKIFYDMISIEGANVLVAVGIVL